MVHNPTGVARIAARIGLASVLLFGVCCGVAGTLFLLGYRHESGWLGLPMFALAGSLAWSMHHLGEKQ